MAVNALGFLDSICITVFMSLCDIVGISDRLADHDSLSTQRNFQGKQLSSRHPRSGSCDRSDPDVAIKAYCFYVIAIMRHLYKFTISHRCNVAWKTSRFACAHAGSRY